MLSVVWSSLMSMISYMKTVIPFELGDGLNGMFVGSLFTLFVCYSIIELLLDYFNGDSDDSSNSDSK